MANNFISEDDIEQSLLQRLQHLHGFDVLDCNTAKPDELKDGSNRSDKRDVILLDRLREACIALNPPIPPEVIDQQVLPKVCDRRPAMSPIAANKELDSILRDGVGVEFEDADGVKQQEVVRFIDFDEPLPKAGKNRYLAVSQLWIKASAQAPRAAYRRPDVILYVNGLPLVFIELKTPTSNCAQPMTITWLTTSTIFPSYFTATPSAYFPMPLKPKWAVLTPVGNTSSVGCG